MTKRVSKAKLRKDASKKISSMISERGGYSREVLKSFGVSWPPRKGWKKALVDELAGIPVSASAHRQKAIKSGSRKAKSNTFYASWEWKQARYEALQLHGRQCMCCGWTPEPGSKGHLCVDHIKPRSKFPALALDVSNLQVLCNSCNMGKSNVHQDDFRAEWHGEEAEDDPLTAQFNATMQ